MPLRPKGPKNRFKTALRDRGWSASKSVNRLFYEGVAFGSGEHSAYSFAYLSASITSGSLKSSRYAAKLLKRSHGEFEKPEGAMLRILAIQASTYRYLAELKWQREMSVQAQSAIRLLGQSISGESACPALRENFGDMLDSKGFQPPKSSGFLDFFSSRPDTTQYLTQIYDNFFRMTTEAVETARYVRRIDEDRQEDESIEGNFLVDHVRRGFASVAYKAHETVSKESASACLNNLLDIVEEDYHRVHK